jgi:monovalent cation:H+ antiporter-2, CPA2 family
MHGSILLELGVMLLVLGILGALSLRVSLSPIPLYLLTGLAFSGSGLLPLTRGDEFIPAGAEIGVILLLFTLGLEYTASDLVSTVRSSALTGVLDLVLNAAPGVLAALLLHWGPEAVVAMGGITYVTSSGVTAKVLGDLGWLGNLETPTVLSLLVFEDLAMALYLPILTAMLAGAGLLLGVATLAIALTAITTILVVALRYGRHVERLVASPSDEVVLLKVLGLTLLVAGVTQRLQMSAAVGAFLVGIALSGPLAAVARDLMTPLRDLFAAVFFVFFGLQTDPHALWPVAGTALLLAFVGILSKGITGWLATRRVCSGPAGRLRAAVALVPRGEFNIVIAGLMVASGRESKIGPLAAAYVMVLAITAPLLAKAAGPLASRISRRRAANRVQPQWQSPPPDLAS